MRDALPQLEARGAKLAIIGNGRPEHARDFAEQAGLSGAVWTDPRRSVYRALGMKRGLGSTLNASAVTNAFRALKSGHRQSSVKGDPWQQGGTLVVAQGGALLYGYISETGGDNAPIDDVLASLPAAV